MINLHDGFRTVLLSGIVCIVCSACIGSGSQTTLSKPDPQSIAQPVLSSLPGPADSFLPAPSTLIQHQSTDRQAAFVEADVIKAGEDYDPMLPSNRITPGVGMAFDPAWSDSSDSVDLLAYAMYAFQISGYDRNAQVRCDWSTPPPTISDAWIGLANWGPDTWDWYRCNASGITELPAIEPYLAFGGGLLLCMVVSGVDNSTLAEVRIGSQLPVPVLSANTYRGFAPLAIDFNAETSSDPDGTIVRYEWDVDGDGTFETDTAGTATHSHEYTSPASYYPALRVTDDDGLTVLINLEIGVSVPFTHTWGDSPDEFVEDCAADSAGNFYLAGRRDALADSATLLTKFDATGQPIWCRLSNGLNWDTYTGMAIAADDRIYACGYTDSSGSGDEDGLLQCWNTDGELLWSKVWGGVLVDMFNDILIASGDLFVVGISYSFGSAPDAVLARFTADGELVYDKHFGGPDFEVANAIGYTKVLFGDPVLHVVGATQSNPPFDFDVLYYTFKEDGSYLTRKTFGDDGLQEGREIATPGFLIGKTIIAGTTTPSGLSNDLLITAVDGSWAKCWDWGSTDEFDSIVRLADGNYMLAGVTSLPIESWSDAVLMTVTDTGAGAGLEIRDWQGQADAAMALSNYPAGVFIGGTAQDITGSWSPQTLTLSNHSGTWANVSLPVSAANGTVLDFTPDVWSPTTAVMDSGGGGTDCLFELRQP